MANLLLVDDNLEATQPLAMLLRFFKHQVYCVSSGEEALKYLEDRLPDLVVLDVMMPGLDGMEVLRRIRADQHTGGLAVIMFSAVSDPAYKTEAMSKGADDYLVKGIEFDEIRARIERVAAAGHVAAPSSTDASQQDYK